MARGVRSAPAFASSASIPASFSDRLIWTLGLAAAIWLLTHFLKFLVLRAFHGSRGARLRFWLSQGVQTAATGGIIVVILFLWRDHLSRFASAVTIISAGLTIALQKVVISFAGYVSILRGDVFSVGDRITLGGVRGDVVALSYLRTTVMEMGQPPTVQSAEPAVWVEGRQYTGRIVTITNDKIFDTPVYNYTRQFPYLWEETRIPVRHGDDWQAVEGIMIAAARRHTQEIGEAAAADREQLLQAYPTLERPEVGPRVYVKITDNWVELTVRFLVRERGIRDVKDAIHREILAGMAAAKIDVGSSTLEVTVRRAEAGEPSGARVIPA